MTRERTRSNEPVTVERPPERVGGNVLPLTPPSRERRTPATHWNGLEHFLAALPRMFASRGPAGRGIADRRLRSTFGNDAA